MNSRRVTFLVILSIFAVALVAPLLLMNRTPASSTNSQARELHTLALSLNGDHRYDGEAADILSRASRTTQAGVESFSLPDGSRCWVLTPSVSSEANLTDCP